MTMEFKNIEVSHMRHALRGMRNAMSGWDKSDTGETDGLVTVGESDRGKARRTSANMPAGKDEGRLRGRSKAKAKVPTQADCVAHGLMLAAMSGMFRKNGW